MLSAKAASFLGEGKPGASAKKRGSLAYGPAESLTVLAFFSRRTAMHFWICWATKNPYGAAFTFKK